jgi:hypothetical protein
MFRYLACVPDNAHRSITPSSCCTAHRSSKKQRTASCCLSQVPQTKGGV